MDAVLLIHFFFFNIKVEMLSWFFYLLIQLSLQEQERLFGAMGVQQCGHELAHTVIFSFYFYFLKFFCKAIVKYHTSISSYYKTITRPSHL